MQQKAAAEAARARAEERCAALEVSFNDYRARQRETPEAQLAGEVATHLAARHALEERCTRLTRAKRHYKEQLLRLARELADVQNARSAEREAYVHQAKREVDVMAIQGAATDSWRHAQESKEELGDIKAKLAELQRRAEAAAGATDEGVGGDPSTTTATHSDGTNTNVTSAKRDMEEVRRLLAERAELLATGVYARDDPFIVELDAQMAQLVAKGREEHRPAG